MNKTAIRCGGCEASPLAAPQTGTDSNQGKAIATPVPRNNIRRDTARFGSWEKVMSGSAEGENEVGSLNGGGAKGQANGVRMTLVGGEIEGWSRSHGRPIQSGNRCRAILHASSESTVHRAESENGPTRS